MVRKGLITFTFLSFATIIALFAVLTPLDLESTLNAWYGFGSDNNRSLQPVSFFGIPVFAPFLGLGVRLPLLSGITNSPLAWIAPNVTIISLQIGVISVSLISLIAFLYFVTVRINPKFSTLYFGILILVILSTTWFYAFVNDWTEIAIGYLGIIHLFVGVILLFNPNKRHIRSRIDELISLFILGVGGVLVSLTHVGYLPAIIYPFLFFVFALKPLRNFLMLGRSTKLVLVLAAILFVLKQLQVFDAVSFSEADNLREQSFKNLTSTVMQGLIFAFNTDFTSRAIVLPIGFLIAAGLLLGAKKKNEKGGLVDFRVSVARALWLTSLFSILLIFVNNLGFLPSASQNWLFRDIAVLSGLFSWILLHRQVPLAFVKPGLRFISFCAGTNAIVFLLFFCNIIIGSAIQSTQATTPTRNYIFSAESVYGHGQRVLYDFYQWDNFFNPGTKKIDSREIYSRGYSSITGWPKMRGSMPLMISTRPLEGKIDKFNCNSSLLQFLQVSWVATEFRCDMPIGSELVNGVSIYKNGEFFILKSHTQIVNFPNCPLFDDDCFLKIIQIGEQITSSSPQITACKNDCAYSLDFNLQPNSAYILPIKYDERLGIKELQINSTLKTFQVGGFLGVSNPGENVIQGAELSYQPSVFQTISILAGVAHLFLVVTLGFLLVLCLIINLTRSRRKTTLGST